MTGIERETTPKNKFFFYWHKDDFFFSKEVEHGVSVNENKRQFLILKWMAALEETTTSLQTTQTTVKC